MVKNKKTFKDEEFVQEIRVLTVKKGKKTTIVKFRGDEEKEADQYAKMKSKYSDYDKIIVQKEITVNEYTIYEQIK